MNIQTGAGSRPHNDTESNAAGPRDTSPVDGTGLTLGDLSIDMESMRVELSGTQVSLTLQEFSLLAVLAQEAGKAVAQERLALALWQSPPRQYARHLSVLIARLRAKLDGSKHYRLETVRKRGYGLMTAQTNRMEEIKRIKDGLDVLADIYRYAASGQPIDPDDLERMKWYGVFHRKQTPGYFMFRLRMPNGVLTSEQIEQIGRLSNRFGRGQVDVTTRQNIQLRWLRIDDIPSVFEALDAVRLEYRQSGMDNVRNITGCPMAGLDPEEVLDASPVARAVQDAFVGMREYSNLPRKFNVSVSGCRHDCATSQVHDLSLTPAVKEGRPGFNVRVGGMGGKAPKYALSLDVFVTSEQAPDFCATLIALYRDKGPRENRQSARLRFLIEEWGRQRFRAEIESRFGPLESAGEDQLVSFAGDHIGVSKQKQPGLVAVGCLIPVGRVSGDDLIEFGRLARTYGSGELRLTNNQNLLLVNVPEASLQALLAETLLRTYSPQPSAWLRRTVSCTGKDFCHYSVIDTKSRAVDFATRMEKLMPLGRPLRVHWSGCIHGCGQHYIGDIGVLATRSRTANQTQEAADVYFGGRLGNDPRLATRILEAVPLSQLPQRVAAVLKELDTSLEAGGSEG